MLPAELVERANRSRRPIRGKQIGMSSFQTHRIIVKEDGTKVRVRRNLLNPDDYVFLGKDLQIMQGNYGGKTLKKWYKGRKGYE